MNVIIVVQGMIRDSEVGYLQKVPEQRGDGSRT